MMNYQGTPTLNVTGAPPPASPFAYTFGEDALEARDLHTVQDMIFFSDASVTIGDLLAESPQDESTQTRSLGPVPLTMEVENEDGGLIGLSGLLFTITQHTGGEMVFSNEDQEWPLQLRITAHPSTGKMNFHLSLSYAGLNVALALDGARFFQALSRGGDFRLVGTIFETGAKQTTLHAHIAAGAHPGPNPRLMKLLEQLVLIQEKTGARFIVPETAITSEESLNIRLVARIVETGRTQFKVAPWDAPIALDQAKGLLGMLANENPIPIVAQLMEEQIKMVLDTEVPLGPATFGINQVYVTVEDFERLRRDVDADGEIIRVRLTSYQDCPAEELYMRWLPVEEAAAVYRMLVYRHESPEQFLGRLMEASRQGTTLSAVRLAELIAAIRKNVPMSEASTSNPLVTCSPEEFVNALSAFMHDLDQKARFALAALLFKHDVLSSGKAARFAGMDRVTFLLDLHKIGVAVIDLDEEQLERQSRYVNSQ